MWLLILTRKVPFLLPLRQHRVIHLVDIGSFEQRNLIVMLQIKVSTYHVYILTFVHIAIFTKLLVLSILAPSGCLQYHLSESGVVRSFNYSPSPNSQTNSIGVEGSRQIANLAYGICFKVISSCSITYNVLSSDVYSFTLSGDVGAVDPSILGTSMLQEQTCTTDYVVIPNPSQKNAALSSGTDRFCGLGIATTTSKHHISRKKLNFRMKNNYLYLFHRQYSTVCFICCYGCQ